MTTWVVVILALVAAVYLYPGNVIRRRRARELCRRPSAENEWGLLFPDRSPECFREFLVIFTRAFSLREDAWRAFRPDDKLYEVYRALNPPDWNMGVDSLEYETFDHLLTRQYGIGLRGSVDQSTTLREVFRRATAKGKGSEG